MNNKKINKPKCALYTKSSIYILSKDASSRMLAPIKAEKKDSLYPFIDTLPKGKAADTLGLVKGVDFLKLDDKRTKKDAQSLLSKTAQQHKAHACQTLCSIPSLIGDQRTGYAVLLLALLARLYSYIPGSIIPERPIVQCGDLLSVPPLLRMILTAINGPEWVAGSYYLLRRPSTLEGKRTVPGGSTISTSLYEYVGGTINFTDKERRFWLPLWNRAVAVAPGIPQKVQAEIINASPSVIPFYCIRTKPLTKWTVSLPGENLSDADSRDLDTQDKIFPLMSAIVDEFINHTTKHPKAFHESFSNMEEFLPPVHLGVSTVQATVEARIFAASLCVYWHFLTFLHGSQLLSDAQCEDFMLAARNAVLPAKSPATQITQDSTSLLTGSWDTPEIFWTFLADYLKGAASHIDFSGTPCKKDIVAAVHTLRTSPDQLLILPRPLIEGAYHTFCETNGLSNSWSGVDLVHAILNWSIGLKQELDNSGWQHQFYLKDNIPDGLKRAKISCLAFPLKRLPDSIQSLLQSLQASSYEGE